MRKQKEINKDEFANVARRFSHRPEAELVAILSDYFKCSAEKVKELLLIVRQDSKQ